jgi:hypothetical protein
MDYTDEDFEYLEEKLKIDREDLDVELLQQAQNAFHAGEGAGIHIAKRDSFEYRLKKADATAYKFHRERLIAEGEKSTEKVLEAEVRTDADYNTVLKAYLTQVKRAARWQALTRAFNDRRDMLKELSARERSRLYDERSDSFERTEARSNFDQKRKRV